jgi:hypothetical protein
MNDRSKTGQSSESIVAFSAAASRFCEAVERHPAHSEEQFLREMNVLLPTLYAAAARLHAEFRSVENEADDTGSSVSGLWSQLMDTLEPFLAKSDRYRKVIWSYPDSEVEDQVYEGCLAADLAFVCEYLKPTLSDLPAHSIPKVTIKAWSEFIWLKGGEVTRAMAAIHDALHDSSLFGESN